MAWGKNDNPELIRAQVELEFLRKDNEQLHKQVEKLQEALIAASAPKAFEALQRDKALPDTKEEMEARMKQIKEHAYIAQYLEELEKPLFENADDMTNWLQSGYAKTSMADEPIDPSNKES